MSTQPTDSDCEIVQRIAIGDRQTLSELYIRYQRSLFNYLLQLTPTLALSLLIGSWLATLAAIILEMSQTILIHFDIQRHLPLLQFTSPSTWQTTPCILILTVLLRLMW